ncbi:putative cytochrome c biogenesis protein [Burkholderiales bacterium GJ-E10]|nr:putative cytochrome c biogenesis protein [Burkholderiales bacterium GJ-E10]
MDRVGSVAVAAFGFKVKRVGSIWGAFVLGIPFLVAICPSCTPALVVLLGAAAAMEWIEQLKPLARFRPAFELAGSVLLIVTGLYLLNGYFAVFPWLT